MTLQLNYLSQWRVYITAFRTLRSFSRSRLAAVVRERLTRACLHVCTFKGRGFRSVFWGSDLGKIFIACDLTAIVSWVQSKLVSKFGGLRTVNHFGYITAIRVFSVMTQARCQVKSRGCHTWTTNWEIKSTCTRWHSLRVRNNVLILQALPIQIECIDWLWKCAVRKTAPHTYDWHLIIIIMEICKAPTLRVKAPKKHIHIHRDGKCYPPK